MTPDVFWDAFGAIGTTTGSIATAIAVIVGVKQYLQPLDKRIKVEFGTGIPINMGFDDSLIFINAINQGTRCVNINGFCLYSKKEKYLLNYAQELRMPEISFPISLQPEEKCEINLNRNKIRHDLVGFIKQGRLNKHSRLKVCAYDNSGEYYFAKKTLSIFELCGDLL